MTDESWLNDQIGRFEWHFKRHFLDIAAVLAKDFQEEGRLHPSGFFILAGLTPYFEGVGSHLIGKDSDEAYGVCFKEVLKGQVSDAGLVDLAITFKDCVRNGLSHDGCVRHETELSRYLECAVCRTSNGVMVNPFHLVESMRRHLCKYVADLRNPNPQYDTLREKFCKMRKRTEAKYSEVAKGCSTIFTTSTTVANTTPNPNNPQSNWPSY